MDHDCCDGDVSFVGAEPEQASIKRDQIAEMMWQNYQQDRAERSRIENSEFDYESFDDDDDDYDF